jgi:hypothetical protein
MITMIVIALALGALALLYGMARSRQTASSKRIRHVDVTALRTLMDREDEEFLRKKLPRGRFTRLKRRRILVTFRYVGRISANSAVVMRLGASARFHPDPAVAQTAVQISELAAQIRLQCLVAFAKLSAEFAMPSLQLTPATLVPKYQTLRESVIRLGALEMQNVAPAAVAI